MTRVDAEAGIWAVGVVRCGARKETGSYLCSSVFM